MTEKNQDFISESALLNEDAVKDWILICESRGEKGKFARIQISKELEHRDPIALEFFKKAYEINPGFIRNGPFGNFLDFLESE